MTDSATLRLWTARDRAEAHAMIDKAPNGYSVRVAAPTRSDVQNRNLWPCLTDLSEQVEWHGFRLSPEEWKDLLTASLKRQRIVPGIDSGFVAVGGRTSTMTVSEFADLLALVLAFGDEREVRWSDPRAQESAA